MEQRPASRIWDLSTVVAPIITVLGITVGAWQFSKQMSHESTMEFSRSMYSKKLQAYGEVGKAVGDLLVVPHDEQLWISAADTIAFDSCFERFRTCSWSVLPLLEDRGGNSDDPVHGHGTFLPAWRERLPRPGARGHEPDERLQQLVGGALERAVGQVIEVCSLL